MECSAYNVVKRKGDRMKLKKQEEKILLYLMEHEEDIKDHFYEWYTWKELCEILDLKYSNDTKQRNRQQSALGLFTKLENNGENGKKLKFTMTGFTDLYNSKKNNISHITMEQFELAFLELDDTTLRKRYAKNLLIHLFLKIVGNANDEEERKKYMDSSDITQWYITQSDLCKAIGITSQSANFVLKNIDDFINKMNIDIIHKDIVQDHFKMDKEWQQDTLNSTLNYLSEKLNVISYTDKAYKIEMYVTKENDYGQMITEPQTTYTTLDEIEWINKKAIPLAIKDMATDMEKQKIYIGGLRDIYRHGLADLFYKNYLIKAINKNAPKWFLWGEVLNVTKCYRIGFNFEIVDLIIHDTDRVDLGITQNEIDELNYLKEINVNETVNIAREETVDKRQESTIKRHEKALSTEEQSRTETEKIRAKYEYVEVGYMVNTELHNSKTKYRKYYGIKPHEQIIARLVD